MLSDLWKRVGVDRGKARVVGCANMRQVAVERLMGVVEEEEEGSAGWGVCESLGGVLVLMERRRSERGSVCVGSAIAEYRDVRYREGELWGI